MNEDMIDKEDEGGYESREKVYKVGLRLPGSHSLSWTVEESSL